MKKVTDSIMYLLYQSMTYLFIKKYTRKEKKEKKETPIQSL